MTKSKTILRLSTIGAFCLAAAVASNVAHAGSLISAVGIQDGSTADVSDVTRVAGQTASIATGGATAQAQTSYGINRIYNQGTAGMDGESYASSVWSQSFVAQGTGTVHLSFTFTIDGSVDYGAGGSGRYFNYILSALAGNWDLSTVNGYDDIAASRPFTSVETVGAQLKTFNGTQLFHLDEIGKTLFTHATSGPTVLDRTVTRDGDPFLLSTYTQDPFTYTNIAYYPDHFTNTNIAGGAPLPYTVNPSIQQAYNNLRTNFAVLGQASLCPDIAGAVEVGCLTGVVPPTPLTLEFDIAAGATFTLFSSLASENAEDATVDFFHTVRLTDIVATGGTLTSDNPLFVSTGDGRYGFTEAAVAAVPEPSTWAMLVVGFGLIGGGMRRKAKASRSTGLRWG